VQNNKILEELSGAKTQVIKGVRNFSRLDPWCNCKKKWVVWRGVYNNWRKLKELGEKYVIG
jgi:hypothetical protein